MATTKKTKTRRPSSKARSSRAASGPRKAKPAAKGPAKKGKSPAKKGKSPAKKGKSPAKKGKSPAKKGESVAKSPPQRKQAAPEAPEPDLPEFAVAFIDGDGQAHVAVAAAPDPAGALAELLEQAAMFEEPFLDDLVAVMVTHPTTWESVKTKVVGVFSE